MDEPITNELPENYQIDEDIFFSEDDKKEFDMGRGKPKRDKDKDICSSEQIKNKKVSGPNIETMSRNEGIIEKSNFLKRFEERVERRGAAEAVQKSERERKRREKKQVREKLQRGAPFKECQPNADKPRDLSVCGITSEEHEYVYDFFDGQVVVTRCKQCSKIKEWYPYEWRKYQTFAAVAVNPNPEIFPF